MEIHWRRIIHALTECVKSSPSNDSDGKRAVDQALFELLSLALECLRSFLVPSSQDNSKMQPCVETAGAHGDVHQLPLVKTLEVLCHCVRSSHCVLSLTKLLSVACRLTKSLDLDIQTFIQLKDTFCYLAASKMTYSSLKHWFSKEGSVALQLTMQACGRESECIQGSCMSVHDNIHGTVIRKYLLLAFRLWAVQASLLKGMFLLPLIVWC